MAVLTVGISLLYVLLNPTNENAKQNVSLRSAKDSLEQNLAVFWPEKNCYFRVNDGRWEYSKNHFEIPFKPVASEEAARELILHFEYDPDDSHTDANHQQKAESGQKPKNNTKVRELDKVEIKKEPKPESKLIVINYKGKSYRLKEGFTTKEGLAFNMSYWRFFNSTWKKSDDQQSWKAVQENDISYLLTKVATEIKEDASKQKETAEQKKKREYNEAVNRLKSQGYKQGSPGAGQQVDKSTTLTNPQGQTVNFWKPKAEEKIEVPKVKQDWWAQFIDDDGNFDSQKICEKISEIKKRQNETGKNRDKVVLVAKTGSCWN